MRKIFKYNNIVVISVIFCSFLHASKYEKPNSVMSIEKFVDEINNSDFFSAIHQTFNDKPLEKYEIEMINTANKNEKKCYGAIFDDGRDIVDFNGDTLVVGGGKSLGKYGENQGKTLLYDIQKELDKIDKHISLINTSSFPLDPHTGTSLKTKEEKREFINKLAERRKLYRQYYTQRNEDILSRFYTINIDKHLQPDILASITCLGDTSVIPSNKFSHVEFENVPCDVFLNPNLYVILERITKPGGTISLSITNACRRLILPVIQNTKFGDQYTRALESEYQRLGNLHPTYHRIAITVINN